MVAKLLEPLDCVLQGLGIRKVTFLAKGTLNCPQFYCTAPQKSVYHKGHICSVEPTQATLHEPANSTIMPVLEVWLNHANL